MLGDAKITSVFSLLVIYFLPYAKWSQCQYFEADVKDCVFPFKYKGIEYKECTVTDRKFKWCSLTAEFDGHWKYCYDKTKTNWTCSTPCVNKDYGYPMCTSSQTKKPMFCLDLILSKYREVYLNRSAPCSKAYSNISSLHVACRMPSKNLIFSGIRESDKELIVNLHNEYRMNVDPPAADMQRLYWDDELAMIAQKHADTCSFTHDELALRVKVGYNNIQGQNIAVARNALQHNWIKVFEDMFNGEKRTWKYGKGMLDKFKDRNANHYLLSLEKAETQIGCGYAECVFSDYIEKFYVCNYDKMLHDTKMPYTEGKWCEKCPNNCYKDKLCDCKGKECGNDGELDPKTCRCRCKGFFKGDNCLESIVPYYNKTLKCYFPFMAEGELHYKCVQDSVGYFCGSTYVVKSEKDMNEC